MFLPKAKIDEDTAQALGLGQEFLEDNNGDSILEYSQDIENLEDIDNSSTAALQDIEGLNEQNELETDESYNDEEVAVLKSDWDRFAANNP